MDTAAMLRAAQNGHPWPPLYGHHAHNALARSAPAVLQKGPAFPHNAMLAEMSHLPFRVPTGNYNCHVVFFNSIFAEVNSLFNYFNLCFYQQTQCKNIF